MLRKIAIITLLAVFGISIGGYFFAQEVKLVENQLISFPSADHFTHQLRPYLLLVGAFLPFFGAVYYYTTNTINRYVFKKLLHIFMICQGGFILLGILGEMQNSYGDFQGRNDLVFKYFLYFMPAQIVKIVPFALILSSLYTLGQFSSHREIVAMIQTGRSLFFVIQPMLVFGLLCTVFCLIMNFHWGPWGELHKDGVRDQVKEGAFTVARDLVSFDKESKRFWYVGYFPRNFIQGDPLKYVEITQMSADNTPVYRLRADAAKWNQENGNWEFENAEKIQISGEPLPLYQAKQERLIETSYQETPAELLSPVLEAESLGVPDLVTWFKDNAAKDWVEKQGHFTYFHYRFAQPWSCLIAVLLAAPLGVVFTRRGVMGGVATAIVLILLMFFSEGIFQAMGSGGYLNPAMAAWGTNFIFLGVAAYLMLRRIQGASIYDAIRRFFDRFAGKDSTS